MRPDEINSLSVGEISQRVVDLKRDLFSLRFQHSSGQLENPKRILHTKKDIARLKTVLTSKSKVNP